MTKENAEETYNETVKENLEKIRNKKIESALKSDPDKDSRYSIQIDNIDILLAQDGLCSLKRIVEFSNNIEEDYRLIRSGMFGVLYWPPYAQSINQMRSATYKDRIDLLLNDIRKFYKIVNEKTELTSDTVQKIWKNCDLARAYLFSNTFFWLRSFKDFNGFVENDERNIRCFLPDPIEEPWKNTGKGFTKEYYDELLRRVEEYRKNNHIEN